MKKLRMIITSVIVLAIVGGAFAFKTKAGTLCVVSNTSSDVCTTVKQQFHIVTSGAPGTNYKYYPNWDGGQAACTDANHNCTALFRVTTE